MRVFSRAVLMVGALSLGVSSTALPAAAAGPPAEQADQFADQADAPAPEPAAPSEGVTQMADWVAESRDNGGMPFAIIDKAEAEVFVFTPDGRLSGGAPALLGLAYGDDSAPDIGQRPLSKILPEEKTTPAGRFLAGYGRGLKSEPVLWIDYDTSVSLHPVVTTNPRERRLERLASPSVDDNRITFGCINVPAEFYGEVVRPAFTGTRGVFYILPETRPVEAVFPAFRAPATAASTGARGGAS